MFTKEIFLYFGVIRCTSGRIPGTSMSHPLEATSAGCGRPVASTNGLTPDLADQDPSLLLIDKILAGIDVEESSRQLHNLHYRKVVNYFRRKGFPPEESRDLTQDVFVRVFKAIDTFRRESRFERWLLEIAANIFRNELRRKGAEKRDAPEVSIDIPPEGENGPGLKVEPVSEDKNALDSIVDREQRKALLTAFQKLPVQMRTCCELRYLQGLKYHEIATVMKISIETVKAHLHQARKRLAEIVGRA
jgi:RNA polymerase sigma-70 factor (ECF subfamily)